MKKLLHERLRELSEGSFLDDLGEILGIGRQPDNELLGEYWDRIIPALADEIERYYIPRPRFEDGEPVQFGGKVHELPGKVYSFEIFEDGSGNAIDFCDNKVPITESDNFFYYKRPQPKVLDADGVEIKVGDTVYDNVRGFAIHVEEIYFNNKSPKVIGFDDDGNKCVYCVDNLTHKEPDSLEKLRDDMKQQIDESYYSNTSPFCQVYTRLSALIERGA